MSDHEQGDEQNNGLFVFPEWHNKIPPLFFLVIGPVATVLAIGAVWYYFSPKFTDVGYMPKQPVPYSHKLHAGEMQLDCRYCHTGVETTAKAGVPPTETCMNCHSRVRTDSEKLAPVRDSWKTGDPVPWVRVHKVADYAYFDHSPHIQAGVGCESCHGRIDQMVEVRQEKPLSMSWCVDCHKDPGPNLRPKDKVTVMGYVRTAADEKLIDGDVNPPIHCGGCHR
jgi:hypothetical protein